MQKGVNRIILDTNLWISFLISKDFSKLDELLFTKSCTLVFSQELIDEFPRCPREDPHSRLPHLDKQVERLTWATKK